MPAIFQRVVQGWHHYHTKELVSDAGSWTHSRLTESETLRMRPGILCWTNPSDGSDDVVCDPAGQTGEAMGD
jgi:hypothetical protein